MTARWIASGCSSEGRRTVTLGRRSRRAAPLDSTGASPAAALADLDCRPARCSICRPRTPHAVVCTAARWAVAHMVAAPGALTAGSQRGRRLGAARPRPRRDVHVWLPGGATPGARDHVSDSASERPWHTTACGVRGGRLEQEPAADRGSASRGRRRGAGRVERVRGATGGPSVDVRRPSSCNQNASTSPSWCRPRPSRLRPSTGTGTSTPRAAGPGASRAARPSAVATRGSTWCACGRLDGGAALQRGRQPPRIARAIVAPARARIWKGTRRARVPPLPRAGATPRQAASRAVTARRGGR